MKYGTQFSQITTIKYIKINKNIVVVILLFATSSLMDLMGWRDSFVCNKQLHGFDGMETKELIYLRGNILDW